MDISPLDQYILDTCSELAGPSRDGLSMALKTHGAGHLPEGMVEPGGVLGAGA